MMNILLLTSFINPAETDIPQSLEAMAAAKPVVATCFGGSREIVSDGETGYIITHHGKSAAVLIDVGEFEALLQRLELLEDIQDGESQIDAGKGIPHEKALKKILKRVAK